MTPGVGEGVRPLRAAIVAAGRWVPPFVAVAFVMAGFFKGTEALAAFPVDLTLAFAGLTAAAIGLTIGRTRVPTDLHGVLAAFLLLVPAAFLAAPTEYGADKVTRLFTFTLLAVVAPILLVRSLRDVERFLWIWAGVCGVVVASALLNPQATGAYTGAPVTTDGVDTTDVGTASALVLIVVVLAFVWGRINFLAAAPICAGAGYVMLQSGSRGPFLATIVAVVAGIAVARARPGFGRAVFAVALGAIGLYAAFLAAPVHAQERIVGILRRGLADEVGTRSGLWSAAVRTIADHPLGVGWGGYRFAPGLDYPYAHNLVLETLAEAGVLLGGLFLVWIAVGYLRARAAATTFAGATAFAVLTFLLLASMVSGDLNSNRLLFLALGITIAHRVVRHDVAPLPGTPGAAGTGPVPAAERAVHAGRQY